ncbi:MAG: hypothetical protein V4581_17485 [Bacteroidota bacterium]
MIIAAQQKNESHSNNPQLWFALGFPFFTLLALGIDSPAFMHAYFDGRQLANTMAVCYFLGMFWASGSRLRGLMLVMVPLSYIGELIFCKLLGMYEYRNGLIPLYVPIGHAVIYASGYIYAYTRWAKACRKQFGVFFAVFFTLLFLYVGVFLNDIFSVISGVLFLLLLRRKRWQNLYCFVALCVIFIEMAGTLLKCWYWMPKIFGVLPAANPPMGAVFFYAGGDVLLAKIVDLWEKKKLKNIE